MGCLGGITPGTRPELALATVGQKRQIRLPKDRETTKLQT